MVMCNLKLAQPAHHHDLTSDHDSVMPSCVPASRISQAAFSYARNQLHPLTLAHSLRVWIYAQHLQDLDKTRAASLQPTAGPDVFASAGSVADDHLFVAALFHDIGTCAPHDHDQRFEVCGADAAVAFLSSFGDAEARWSRGDIEKVLGDAVVEQALGRPAKAPQVSWPWNMVRAKLAEPEWEGMNKGF
ncbi:hypothetical protein F5Y15DRAFT_424468 [Xylariaceae sp. FL0016]|nr:hypothetical protein F5Y15DRAFT_424468 [Xylariaceae sp. FL0016]